MSETFANTLQDLATNEQLHTGQLFIFSKMDQADLKTFQEIWPTIPASRRQEITQELVEISEINFEVDFEPVFLLGLGDADADVRANSISGLWENERPSLIVPFIHLLKTDEVPLVRATAASALGRFVYLNEIEEIEDAHVEPIKQALLETIHQPAEDVEVRRRAIEAIAYVNNPQVTRIIESAYYDEDEKMQVSAIFGMGRSADTRWRPQVISELENSNSEIRFEAARACGELEAGDAVPKLIELIDEDDDPQVKEVSIWALGRIGGQTAREALEICTNSDNEAIVLAAEEALEEIDLFSGAFDLLDLDSDFDDIFDLMDEELDEYSGNYHLN